MSERTDGTDAPDETVRVLVTDDDPFVRRALAGILDDAGLDVVGLADDGEAAVQLVAAAQADGPVTPVDVVLMDLQMPVLDGVAATVRLRELPEPPGVVVLSVQGAEVDVVRALQAGASGYLVKTSGPDEIVGAVRAAAAGESVFSPEAASALVSAVRRSGATPSDVPDGHENTSGSWRAHLTEREIEVALAVAGGRSNQQIAEELFMSVSTVKSNVSRILTKLDLDNRVQIALVVHGLAAR